MEMKMPKINKKKEFERFKEMINCFDKIQETRERMDQMPYLLPRERQTMEEILFDVHIRTLRNIEWQRKILGLPKSLVGDVEELIKDTEEIKKKVMKRIKEGKTKTKELFE